MFKIFIYSHNTITTSEMKVKLSILFFVFCLFFSNINAQPRPPQLRYPNCSNAAGAGWVEVIVVFPRGTPNGVIGNLRIKVDVTQMDSIPTLNAYLWRMCKGQTIYGTSLTINGASDGITHISNGASSISVGGVPLTITGSPNYPTSATDITSLLGRLFDSTTSLLSDKEYKKQANESQLDLQICSPNPVNIFVLDSGNKGGNNAASVPFIGTDLRNNKAKCFITNSNNPLDSCGHGTSVISIIATIFRDLRSSGMIIPSNTITSVKVLDSLGKGTYWQYLQGFAYALDNGAQVINSSIIIKSSSVNTADKTPIDIAMEYAESRRIMVVTGAGNDTTKITRVLSTVSATRTTTTTTRFLPADITNNYLITVAASTSSNTLAPFSNYGQTGSLVAAPGVAINTMDYLTGNIRQGTGTSFSTPFVTATYAVLKYMSPTSDETLLKNVILKTTTHTSVFRAAPKRCDFGILNSDSAYQLLKDTLCPRPSTPSVSSLNMNAAVIQWTSLSSANGYVVQYKRAIDTVWITATGLNVLNATASLTGLTVNTQYVVRVRSNCSDSKSVACIINYSPELSFTTLSVPTCPNPITPSVSGITNSGTTLSWIAVAGAQSYNLEYKVATATTWTTITSITTPNRVLSGLLSNTAYNVRITADCSAKALSMPSTVANFTTLSLSCTDIYEPNETRTAAKVIALNTDIKAKIGTSSDVDWYKITTTIDGLLTVTLRELSANYNLFLYDGTGILRASSTQAGMTNESLQWTSIAGTYYIQVVGVSGAFHANNCYILRAKTSDIGIIQLRGLSAGSGIAHAPAVAMPDIDVTVFPNPITTDQFSVNINSKGTSQVSLTIFDTMGRIVYQNPELSLEKGQTVQSIDFSKQTNGLYILHF